MVEIEEIFSDDEAPAAEPAAAPPAAPAAPAVGGGRRAKNARTTRAKKERLAPAAAAAASAVPNKGFAADSDHDEPNLPVTKQAAVSASAEEDAEEDLLDPKDCKSGKPEQAGDRSKPPPKKSESKPKKVINKGFLNSEAAKSEKNRLYPKGEESTLGEVSQKQKEAWATHESNKKMNEKLGLGDTRPSHYDAAVRAKQGGGGGDSDPDDSDDEKADSKASGKSQHQPLSKAERLKNVPKVDKDGKELTDWEREVMVCEKPNWFNADWPSKCQYNQPGCDLGALKTTKHASEMHGEVVSGNPRWAAALQGVRPEREGESKSDATSRKAGRPPTELRLSFLGVKDSDLGELTKACGNSSRNHHKVHTLDLSYNHVSDAGVQALVGALLGRVSDSTAVEGQGLADTAGGGGSGSGDSDSSSQTDSDSDSDSDSDGDLLAGTTTISAWRQQRKEEDKKNRKIWALLPALRELRLYNNDEISELGREVCKQLPLLRPGLEVVMEQPEYLTGKKGKVSSTSEEAGEAGE